MLAASGRYGSLVGQPTLALGDTPLGRRSAGGWPALGNVFEGGRAAFTPWPQLRQEALIHLPTCHWCPAR